MSQLQNITIQHQTQNKNELEKSIEHIIGKFEDYEREEELERLIRMNEELQNEVDGLRKVVKEYEKENRNNQIIMELREENEMLKDENEELGSKINLLIENDRALNKQIENLKVDYKKLHQQFVQNKEQEISK